MSHECNSMRLCRFYEFPTSKTGLIHRCFLCSSFSLSLTQLLCPTFFPFHILSPSDMICSMNVIDSKVLLWASLHICWYKSGSNLEIFVFNHCLQQHTSMFYNCHGVPTSKVHVFYSVEFFFTQVTTISQRTPNLCVGNFFFFGGGCVCWRWVKKSDQIVNLLVCYILRTAIYIIYGFGVFFFIYLLMLSIIRTTIPFIFISVHELINGGHAISVNAFLVIRKYVNGVDLL